MADEYISPTDCQPALEPQEDIDLSLLGKLTPADRQAIRDHARAAADAMAGAAASILERWAKPSGVDEVALHRAVRDAFRVRVMADALEPKGQP
jgi:hypothetical protein